jgi:membrane fusion protein, multidrug efflux system
MRTEVRVPNPDGALMPGMYVAVALTLATPHQILEVPSTALYSDAEGLRLATVDASSHIKLVKITIERDTGAALQIATGLTGSEQIVKIAIPTLRDGDLVDVVPAAAGSAH